VLILPDYPRVQHLPYKPNAARDDLIAKDCNVLFELGNVVVEEKIDIGYSATGSKKILWSLKRGQPAQATFKELCAAVAPKEFELHINLNLGKANAVMYAADLTEEYVDFNKGDVGDPSSLGG